MACDKCQIIKILAMSAILAATVEASIRRFDLDDLKLMWKKTSSDQALTRFLKKDLEFRKYVPDAKEELDFVPLERQPDFFALERAEYAHYNPYPYISLSNDYNLATLDQNGMKYVDSSNFRNKNSENSATVAPQAAKVETTTARPASLGQSSSKPTHTTEQSTESSTTAISWGRSLLIDEPVHYRHIPRLEPDKSERYTHSILYGQGLGF